MVENFAGFIQGHVNSKKTALRRRTRQFVKEKCVIETRERRLMAIIGEIDSIEASPVDCRQAHGTRLAAGINCRPSQAEIVQRGARLPDGDDFRMSGRVVRRRNLIPAFSDHPSVLDDDGAERSPAAADHVLARQSHGMEKVSPVIGDTIFHSLSLIHGSAQAFSDLMFEIIGRSYQLTS